MKYLLPLVMLFTIGCATTPPTDSEIIADLVRRQSQLRAQHKTILEAYNYQQQSAAGMSQEVARLQKIISQMVETGASPVTGPPAP